MEIGARATRTVLGLYYAAVERISDSSAPLTAVLHIFQQATFLAVGSRG